MKPSPDAMVTASQTAPWAQSKETLAVTLALLQS
jgi:hypothetical protein